MSEGAFYENGLCFSCTQCSSCCRGEPGVVLLSHDDLAALAEWAGVTAEQFKLMYCRWVRTDDGTKLLSLREKQNYDCILWQDGGCTAYGARPVQCRTYPFWSSILSSREAWERRSRTCPGMRGGAMHTKQEIEEQLAAYRARRPLAQ